MIKFETLLIMSLRWKMDTIMCIVDNHDHHFHASCLLIYKLNPTIIYFDRELFVVSTKEFERMKMLLKKYKKEGSVYIDNGIYKSRS